MIHITAGHRLVTVRCDTGEEVFEIQKLLTYQRKDYEHDPEYLRGEWDGNICLLNVREDTGTLLFPSGLLNYVTESLTSPYEVIDNRLYVNTFSSIKGPIPLKGVDYRWYQKEGILSCIEKNRGIISLPTGTGKTILMLGLIKTLHLPTLWLTHEGGLFNQTLSVAKEYLSDTFKIGEYSGDTKNLGDFTVGMVQSIHRNREDLSQWLQEEVQVLVIDECHHVSARTWYETCLTCNAAYRYGCSATPLNRADGASLEVIGVLGDVIYEKSVEELKEYVTRPKVYFLPVNEGPKTLDSRAQIRKEILRRKLNPDDSRAWTRVAKSMSRKLWTHIYTEGIIKNEKRNALACSAVITSFESDRPCMLFVSRIDHGEYLTKKLRKVLGRREVQFVSGKVPKEKRTELFQSLQEGKVGVLVVIDAVAGEGQDIPALSSVIIAGGGKAEIGARQNIGRGMRLHGIKDLKVYDFMDSFHKRLCEHSKARRRHYAKSGAEVIMVGA